MSGDDIEHGDFLIALVPTDASPPRYTAQVHRKDGKHFTFHDSVTVEPATSKHASVSVITTDIFATPGEAIDAGHMMADRCKVQG